MSLLGSLEKSMNDLGRAGASFATVGGLAVGIRTEPRFTRDADMAVSVTGDHEAAAVVFGLIRSGYKLVASLEQEVAGRLATVRLVPPLSDDAGVIVDLLVASCGIEPEVVAAATSETIARAVVAPVATIGHLIAMKTLLESDTRNQVRQDLIELIRAAPTADLEIARASVALIAERGFSRHKDLGTALQRFVTLARGRSEQSP